MCAAAALRVFRRVYSQAKARAAAWYKNCLYILLITVLLLHCMKMGIQIWLRPNLSAERIQIVERTV
jgi:hypothetical protein